MQQILEAKLLNNPDLTGLLYSILSLYAKYEPYNTYNAF